MLQDNRRGWASYFGVGGPNDDLYTEEEKRRLQQAQMQAMGSGMLEASGWTSMPVTLGQAWANASGRGQEARQYAEAGLMERRKMMAEQAKQQQLKDMIAKLPPEQQAMAQAFGLDFFKSDMEQQNKLKLEQEKAKLRPEKRSSAGQMAMDAGLQPGTPEYQAFVRDYAAKPTGTNVDVSLAGESAFAKEMGKLDARTVGSWREGAIVAGDTLDTLDALEQINSLKQGGKVQEAVNMAGQWFGTDAAANEQAFDAAAGKLVLNFGQQLKGAMSDGDREMLRKMGPQFGADPRANKVIIDIIRRAALRQMENAQQADTYSQQNNGLRGFAPKVRAATPEQAPIPSAINLDEMSPEEIEDEMRRRGLIQ
jgi:hypothetical protein